MDAADGITTGISAHDRALTARTLAAPAATWTDLTRPGHVVPLLARPGCTGAAEASVELCRRVGLAAVAVLATVEGEEPALAGLPRVSAAEVF